MTAGVGYSNIKAGNKLKIYIVLSKGYHATKNRFYISPTRASGKKVILLEKVEAFSICSGIAYIPCYSVIKIFQGSANPI